MEKCPTTLTPIASTTYIQCLHKEFIGAAPHDQNIVRRFHGMSVAAFFQSK